MKIKVHELYTKEILNTIAALWKGYDSPEAFASAFNAAYGDSMWMWREIDQAVISELRSWWDQVREPEDFEDVTDVKGYVHFSNWIADRCDEAGHIEPIAGVTDLGDLAELYRKDTIG